MVDALSRELTILIRSTPTLSYTVGAWLAGFAVPAGFSGVPGI